MACATLKRPLDFDPVCHNVHPTKRPRCAPMVISPSSSPPSTRYHLSHSVFSSVCPRMSPETMTRNIHEEIRRFERRKLLRKSAGSHSPPYVPDSVGSTFSPDKPLFTFRQVGLICERLINERENQIREEYDRFLIAKLTEQYESFVNFSNDQVQKRFDGGAIPSYLS